jgi:hypothetical protein
MGALNWLGRLGARVAIHIAAHAAQDAGVQLFEPYWVRDREGLVLVLPTREHGRGGAWIPLSSSDLENIALMTAQDARWLFTLRSFLRERISEAEATWRVHEEKVDGRRETARGIRRCVTANR